MEKEKQVKVGYKYTYMGHKYEVVRVQEGKARMLVMEHNPEDYVQKDVVVPVEELLNDYYSA